MCAAQAEVQCNRQWPGKQIQASWNFLHCKTGPGAKAIKAKEKSLKRRRHIEITAFRRQVTIYCGDRQVKNENDVLPSRDESRPNTDGTDRLTIGLGEGCDASLNAAPIDELVLLAEALLESEDKTSVAAQRLSLSQSGFHSKLRSLGLSMRNLITDLNLFSDHRAATKRVKGKYATWK
jgi:hypothetical protein